MSIERALNYLITRENIVVVFICVEGDIRVEVLSTIFHKLSSLNTGTKLLLDVGKFTLHYGDNELRTSVGDGFGGKDAVILIDK